MSERKRRPKRWYTCDQCDAHELRRNAGVCTACYVGTMRPQPLAKAGA